MDLSLRPASFRANAEDVRLLRPFLSGQRSAYEHLDVPVISLVSLEDHVVSPVLHAPRLHDLVPRGRLVEISGAGHQLLYTHPDDVLDAVEWAWEQAP